MYVVFYNQNKNLCIHLIYNKRSSQICSVWGGLLTYSFLCLILQMGHQSLLPIRDLPRGPASWWQGCGKTLVYLRSHSFYFLMSISFFFFFPVADKRVWPHELCMWKEEMTHRAERSHGAPKVSLECLREPQTILWSPCHTWNGGHLSGRTPRIFPSKYVTQQRRVTLCRRSLFLDCQGTIADFQRCLIFQLSGSPHQRKSVSVHISTILR